MEKTICIAYTVSYRDGVARSPSQTFFQTLGEYDGVIFALGVSGKWAKAVSLLDEIEADGLVADEKVYTEVFLACGKVRICNGALCMRGVPYLRRRLFWHTPRCATRHKC